MKQLLRWFKTEFFKWVDQLDCDFCGSKFTKKNIGKGHNERSYNFNIHHECIETKYKFYFSQPSLVLFVFLFFVFCFLFCFWYCFIYCFDYRLEV